MPAMKANNLNARLSLKDIILFSTVIGALTLIIHPYTYGLGNHFEQLPLIFRVLDPAYLKNDFFVNSSITEGPRSYYTMFMSSLGSFAPIPAVFLVLTWLSHSAIVLVTYYAARDISGGSDLAAMIACSLVMAVEGITIGFGANLLKFNYFIPGLLALPMALMSLWEGIKMRPLASALWALPASLIHPLVGLETGAIAIATSGTGLLFCPGCDNEAEGRKYTKFRELAAGTVILAGIAFLGFGGAARETVDPMQFIRVYAYFRIPHHLLPSTFGTAQYLATLSFLIASIISWKWWQKDTATDKCLALRVLLPVLFVLILCIGGYIFVEVIPSRLWTTAQTFRLTYIIKWLGFILFSRAATRLLEKRGGIEQKLPALMMLSGTGFSEPFFALGGHIIEWFKQFLSGFLPQREIKIGLWVVAIILIFCLLKFIFWEEFIGLAVFFSISSWFLYSRGRKAWRVVPVSVVALMILLLAFDRYYQIPLLTKIRPIIVLSDLDKSGDDIARFARQHTEEDAIFLTPPWFGRFRLIGRRAIVIGFKAFPFQDKAMLGWKKRLDDCYGETKLSGFSAVGEMDESYKKISEEHIIFLKEKYKISYAVLYKETPSKFPILFEDNIYKLVKVTSKE